MRKWYVFLAVLASVVIVGSVSASSADQGRRLAGPFCVGKSFLKPLDGSKVTNRPNFRIGILRAGVVRSVALGQKCQPWENPKVGLAVTGPPGPQGPPGPKGDPGAAGQAGTQGATGATGATGAAGAAGQKGEQGAKGEKGDTGAKGEKGDTGARGAQGEKGDKGEKGDRGERGERGLGDDTRWICVHGKPLDQNDVLPDDGNGGPLFDGGTGIRPDCKGGAKFAYKVVTSGSIVVFD